ncbi:MAG TPA: Gfo/Idh/MocA family oxidoreductase [Verrucomicrobiae bacterium]|nr:Gfo/Idh/MocA family oxidoreductase [Verrucomicrobiae bacterium]
MPECYKKLAQTKGKLSNRPANMTRQTPPVRIGIIGCGNVLSAYRASIDKLRLRGAAEAIMACGRAAQRATVSSDLGVQRFTTDAQEVLASNDVDAVIILTSMPEHARLTRAALEAGKHVLVEKPLATTLDESKALVELVQRSRGHLVCAPFTILSPTFQTIARRIREGDIGNPCSARARYGWSGPWWNEWFYKPGGGCLFDLGVYCVNSLTGLLGAVKRVTAMTGIAIPEREINGRKIRVESEDNAQVLLDFGDACFAVVTTGFTMQQYRNPALEVYGMTGTIQMLGDDWDPDGYELWQNSAGAWQVFKETTPDWSWTDGLNHLIDCIRDGTQPLVTPAHAHHVLEIMLKAQQAGREGRTLSIESTFTPPNFGENTPKEAAHLVHDRTREH